MKLFGILGIAAAVFAAGATEVQVSNLTNGAKAGKIEINAKSRVGGNFAFTAIPASLAGETIVFAPRGVGNQPGASYTVTLDQAARVYLLVHNRGKVTIPEGWEKVAGTTAWGDSFSDTIYTKECAAGAVEVPVHDGKQGDNFGVPNALVVTADGKAADLTPTESILTAKSKQRAAGANFSFTELPDSLKNLPMVSVPRGPSNKPGIAYSFEIRNPAMIYILVQDRGTVTGLEGWTKQDEKAGWSVANGKYTDSIYAKSFPAGKVEIPAHDGKEGASFGVPNAAVVKYDK